MKPKLTTRGGAGRLCLLLGIGAALCALPRAGFAQAQNFSFTGSLPSTFTTGLSYTTYVNNAYYGAVGVSTGGSFPISCSGCSGYFTFFPLLSTTYTYAVAPPRTGSATLNVVVVPEPLIYNFSASSYIRTPSNTCTTLSWTAVNVDHAEISPGNAISVGGDGTATGSQTFCVSYGQTYTLTVYNSLGSSTSAQVTVAWNPGYVPPPTPAPYISSFTSSATSVIGGSAALLSWYTGNATNVSVDGTAVSTSGTLAVYPTATRTYTLTASGPGGTTTRQVTVAVVQDAVYGNVVVNSGETRRFEATASVQTGGDESTPFVARAGSNTFVAAIGKVILRPGTRLETGTNARIFSFYNSFLTGGISYRPTINAAKSPHGGTGVRQETLPGSDRLGLEQNEPNPFQLTTLIRYTLVQAGPVRLRVYDLLGREVAQLVDEVKPVGTHGVQFDAGRLPSGVYLYRLQAGNYEQTKRLLLVR